VHSLWHWLNTKITRRSHESDYFCMSSVILYLRLFVCLFLLFTDRTVLLTVTGSDLLVVLWDWLTSRCCALEIFQCWVQITHYLQYIVKTTAVFQQLQLLVLFFLMLLVPGSRAVSVATSLQLLCCQSSTINWRPTCFNSLTHAHFYTATGHNFRGSGKATLKT